jgi:hypothetical protein
MDPVWAQVEQFRREHFAGQLSALPVDVFTVAELDPRLNIIPFDDLFAPIFPRTFSKRPLYRRKRIAAAPIQQIRRHAQRLPKPPTRAHRPEPKPPRPVYLHLRRMRRILNHHFAPPP